LDFILGFYDFLTGIKQLPAARSGDRPAHDQRSKFDCTAADSGPGRPRCVAEYRQLRSITDAPRESAHTRPLHTGGCINGGEIIATAKPLPKPSCDRQPAEMKSLVAEGVKYIQLDEPSFALPPEQSRLVFWK